MLINLDYHDVYWESAKYGIPRMDPDQWLKTVYAAMKPGAIVGVIDHVANPNGDTRATVEKLSPDRSRSREGGFQARRLRAGRRPATCCATRPTITACWCSIPKIRGKTDRFVFKFRKPR